MNSIHRHTPLGRLPERQLPFSTPLAQLEDLPPEFRKTAQRMLEGRAEKIRHILFTPEFGTFGEYCPATVFVVTDDEWVAMSAEKSGAPSVRYADFKQTRLIEFALALLSGHIVLESGESTESSCVLRFNLTSSDLFRDALVDVLSAAPEGGVDDPSLLSGFAGLSMGLQSSLSEALMPGDKALALVAWMRNDVNSPTDRLLMQPGGLLLTEHYVCLFTVEDPAETLSPNDLSHYNRGVIYLRRDLPIAAGRERHGELDKLTLTVGEGVCASSVSVLLPRARKDEIERMLALLD